MGINPEEIPEHVWRLLGAEYSNQGGAVPKSAKGSFGLVARDAWKATSNALSNRSAE
jgi:hypothetical protein